MSALTPAKLQEFLKLASANLSGEWILIGGTLLPAVGLHVRSTVDIDFINLNSNSDQTIKLMEVAEKLGMGVESINQAAAYFLNKISYKKSDLIPLLESKNCQIFRPSVELYWQLKLARLTDADQLDCQHYFHFCKSSGDTVDFKKLYKIIESSKSKDSSLEKSEKLELLGLLLKSR